MQNADPAYGDERGSQKDALDRALDAVLAKYAADEPRAGLEQRVLTRLRSESTCSPNRSWWKLSAAGAIAALLAITLGLAWRSNRPAKTLVLRHPPTPVERVQPATTQIALNAEKPATLVLRPKHKAKGHHAHQSVNAADAPKLDQFPSPAPLTSEELALVHYVRQFPRDAVTVASAQEEFEKEIQQEAARGRQGTSGSTDEQER